MPNILDLLLDVLTAGSCDFCPAGGRVYTDPETGCRYCLTCLETACTLEPLADGPEDPETIALGRTVLDELLPAAA